MGFSGSSGSSSWVIEMTDEEAMVRYAEFRDAHEAEYPRPW
jgi:hypothetical protein